jgi:hypothetical protein
LIFKITKSLPCGKHCVKYQTVRGAARLVEASAGEKKNESRTGALPLMCLYELGERKESRESQFTSSKKSSRFIWPID